MRCEHKKEWKNGRNRQGRQTWRCANCDRTRCEPKADRVTLCHCGCPAVQLFLCEHHWRLLPPWLQDRWIQVSGKGGIRLGERLGIALEIMTWRQVG